MSPDCNSPLESTRDQVPTVHTFAASIRDQWNQIEPTLIQIGNRFDSSQVDENAKLTFAFFADLESMLTAYPHDSSAQDRWRNELMDVLRRYVGSCLQYTKDEQDYLLQNGFQQSTNDFVYQARQFDSSVETDQLFQALRNVWIMNTIQTLYEQPVRLTPSVFAYSMLYPCTDNVLDDVTRSYAQKDQFNDWIEHRILHGEACLPTSDHSVQNHSARYLNPLFDCIDIEFPPAQFPNVMASVFEIQSAQRRAMAQQLERLNAEQILELSIAKGGSSVLAHGYLIASDVGKSEAEFLYGLGVALQLLDDLQDLQNDLAQNHQTLATHAAKYQQNLDEFVLRLLNFMRLVFAGTERFDSKCQGVFRKILNRNCIFLLLTAVAQLPDHCSARLLQQLEPYSPIAFAELRKLKRVFNKRYRRVKRTLLNRQKLASIWNVLGPASSDLWKLPKSRT